MSDKIRIEDASQKYIDVLKKNLCKENHDESWATLHICGACALQLSFDASFLKKIIFRNNYPVLAFGVVKENDNKVICWLMASYELKHVMLFAIRQLKEFIKSVSEDYELIENYVDIRHKQMIKFIKLCGFSLDNPISLGIENMLFQRFWHIRDI